MRIPKKYWFIAFIILASVGSYWRLLTFTFWKDDWFLIWGALHRTSLFYAYWAHPGTVAEFMWLTGIFHTQPLSWQLVGLILHTAIALALVRFIRTLTESTFAAKLTGILYGASFAGLDAVGWASAHVVLWVSLFLVIGLHNFTLYIRRHNDAHLWLALLYLGIALVFDPFRVLPVFVILPLIAFVQNKPDALRVIKTEAVVLVATLLFVVLLLNDLIYRSQFVTLLLNPAALLTRIHDIGNYFNSVSNLFVSWLIRIPEFGSTGEYSPFWARIGFFIFCLTIGIAFEFFNRYRKGIGIALTFLVWIFVFYIPNWFFEPRLTMGGTHRYMVISAIGFIALVGYLLSLIRNRTVALAIAAFFVIVNIVTANHFSAIAAEYRSARKISTLWEQIDRDVASVIQKPIFVFGGQEPIRTFALKYSGGYPFALRRGIADFQNIPYVIDDRNLMEKRICSDTIPLNHLFAWDIAESGAITNKTLEVRRELLIRAMDHDCVPIIDPAALEENK